MPKTLPERGDYCYLTDKEGKRIGRVIDETEKTFKIKYWYDAFSGHVLVERQKNQVQYTKKPVGVEITMDVPEEVTDTEKHSKRKYTDINKAKWTMLREITDLQAKYNALCSSNRLTKKAICDLVIPFRDKYGLSDNEALNLAKNHCSIGETVELIEKAII